MEEDTEDVRKIDEIINRHKTEVKEQDQDEAAYEYGDFINYEELSEPEEIEDDYVLPDFQTTDISKFQTYSPSDLLKDEEKQVVESCSDPELKTLLQLNRTKNIQLMQAYKKVKDLLIECQKNIATKTELIDALKVHKRTFFRVWRLGYPYFKSKDNFPCPRNDDSIEKDKNNELLFYQMTPSKRWNQIEINRLKKGVIFCYKMGKEFELKKRISKLQIEMKKKGCEDQSEELKELNTRLQDLINSNDQEPPPLGSEKYIDWNKVSDSFLRSKYTDLECKVMWRLYLDPHVNKSPWQREEESKLLELVDIYKQQDWDQITNDLGTQRSTLLTCTHYFSNLTKPKKKRFTPEEDEFLYRMVQSYKQGSFIPWSKIAHHFVDKDRQQLFYRYRYNLSLKSKVSGTERKFSEAEDVLLMILVNRFGRKFSVCEEYFPDRSMLQLKARYTSNLRRPIKKGAFSVEEDEAIMKHVREHGESSWVPLQKTMLRYGAQIRQRYRTLAMFLQQNPDMPVSLAPRRIVDNLNGHGKDNKFEFLSTIAERYRDEPKIPTLEDIDKVIKEGEVKSESSLQEDAFCVSKGSTSAIDSLLTEFFVETCQQEEEECSEEEYNRFTTMIQHLLNIFQSTLQIPSDFSHNELDEFDLKIIEKLKTKALYTQSRYTVPHRPSTDLGEIVPPNLETLTALRSLLLSIDKNFARLDDISIFHISTTLKMLLNDTETKNVEWCVNKYLSTLDEDIQNELKEERNIFFRRFVALFKYPAVMSLNNNPRQELLDAAASYTKVPFRRTYSRNKPTVSQTEKNRTEERTVIQTETVPSAETNKPSRHMVWVKVENDVDHSEPNEPQENEQPKTYLKQYKKRTLTKSDVDPLLNKEQLNKVCTSSTGEQNLSYTPTSNLSMVERLKLRIKNDLLDLDKKEKTRMNLYEWKTSAPFSDKITSTWNKRSFHTYTNHRKRRTMAQDTTCSVNDEVNNYNQEESIDIPPNDENEQKIKLDFSKHESSSNFVIDVCKKFNQEKESKISDIKLNENDNISKGLVTEDKPTKQPKIIRLSLSTVEKESEVRLVREVQKRAPKQREKHEIEVRNPNLRRKTQVNFGFLNRDNFEALDDVSLLDRIELERKETEDLKKRSQPSQYEGPVKRLKKIYLATPKTEQEMQDNDIKVGHGTFNFQKGELVEDSDSDSDFQDLQALKNVLNTVKQEIRDDDV